MFIFFSSLWIPRLRTEQHNNTHFNLLYYACKVVKPAGRRVFFRNGGGWTDLHSFRSRTFGSCAPTNSTSRPPSRLFGYVDNQTMATAGKIEPNSPLRGTVKS